ncbi:MAG TPA: glycerol-3-phosphate 1-O-acyltransferase PlsY [Planctomycetota bacterium]|nr:glycerol-3-phosphate 1-O-acyltransferase PlsY [Planctomycetota bacterium]
MSFLDAAAILASYLVGAVPFGLLLVRASRGVDLRQVGSGNIGATNAMRAAGKPVGLAVFALDFLKGLVPVLLAAPAAGGGLSPRELQVACGTAAVVGHCFPVYLRFRGGKGVATGCGALLAIDWRIFLAGGAVWLATLAATRFTGLASMLMGLAFVAAAWVLWRERAPEVVAGAGLLALLILVRHRKNIARMLAGTEPKAFARREPGGEPQRDRL